MLWMKRNAYEESTIRKVAKLLRHLKKNCNTKAPEEVKLYIANKTCGNGHKENLVEAYAIYIRSEGLTWEQPFYQRYDKKRRAPKEKLVDFLINNARIEMKLKLSILKDLGLRPIELTWLRIQDIDLSTGIVSITGAKHTVGREGKLTPKTRELLKIYIATKKLNSTSRIYNGKSSNLSANYRHYRNRIAEEYNMPELKQIQLYDFRHFYATMLYHKTKDLLHVKAKLGHRDLRTTLRYTQLLETLENDEYHCKTAINIKQATQLIENGFEYITEKDGTMLFRKRK